MVDVQQCALRSLEQDVVAVANGFAEHEPGVGDAVPEALRLFQHRVHDPAGIERLAVVDLDQDLVLDVERCLDLLGQDRRIEQVLHADPESGHLVLVGRPDATPRCPDLGLAQVPLGDLIDGHVVRHDQVRVGGDEQSAGVDTTFVESARAR